jgi:hypothetical protein
MSRPYAGEDIRERMPMKKRQVTFSKMAREREVRERRARKLEKKHAAAAERKAGTDRTNSESDQA